MDLYVAVWSPSMDTYLADSLTINLQSLTQATAAAYTYLREAAGRIGSHDPRYLFVAPEYFFVGDADFTLLTVSQRDGLYRNLARVSAANPAMLLFPGTVSWKIELGMYASMVPGNAQNKGFGGTNTAPVYFGGAQVFSYDKRMNDGNYDRSTDAVFTPGAKAALFRHGGLSYGVEVCGDYAENRLAGDVDAPLDVEVMMSATIGHSFSGANMDRVPVRDGGVFIHCDGVGEPQKNGVWVKQMGKGWHGSQDFSPKPGFRPDPSAMRPSTIAAGNMSKIGQLLPAPALDSLACYTVSL